MANPFLVLGGVAVGVIAAGIGVLAVPGWIGSAQDANSVQDLSLISDAQSARLTAEGRYAETVSQLENGSDVRMRRSADTRIFTSTNASGADWVGVSRSKTGVYFARLSGTAALGKGASIEEAVTSAGTTISGPADARVTAQGVPLPRAFELADIVYTNLFPDPGATRAASFGMWAGTGATNTIAQVAAPWSYSGYAVRATRTSPAASVEVVGAHISTLSLTPGATYTMSMDVATNRAASFGKIAFGGSLSTGFEVVASSGATTTKAKVPERVWLTFRAGTGRDARVQAFWGNQVEGDWSEVSNVDLYEGAYDPDRPNISPYRSGDLPTAWLGAVGDSRSVAYR